jgi:hypothetical protein
MRKSHEGTTTNVQQARTQRCVQADMKTLMLTKCRPTTCMGEKNTVDMQSGGWSERKAESLAGRQNSKQAGKHEAWHRDSLARNHPRKNAGWHRVR